MNINDLQISVKALAISPVHLGVLKQYLGDGEEIDEINARISIESGEKITTLIITPKEAFGFDGLVGWLEKVHSVLVKINKISNETRNKVNQTRES